MRTIFAFLAIASSTLAVHDWAIFGSKTLGDVSVARRDVAMGGIFDLSRREFGPDTAVDANNTLSDCQAADVVKCTEGFGDLCCASGGECCGVAGCCEKGFKCGIKLLGKCCREDQDICGGNGCYSETDGETCCGGFEVCSKGQECCGLSCCLGDQACDQGICRQKSDIDVADDEDECCTAGGCCPSGSHCHQRQCIPNAAGRIEALELVTMAVLVGGLVMWNL